MSTGEMVEATRENFRELVADGLVMVDIWGPECKPCLALMPHVAKIAGERPELQVIKLEAPKARRVCIELKVHGLPTFLLMRDGEEVARLSASQLSPTQLREWLDSELAVPQAG
jgi:thioredoxin-like negative regulator of GroEL